MWDIYRIPASLIKKLGVRSYLVQLESGRKLRRNRQQLQARPDEVSEILHSMAATSAAV